MECVEFDSDSFKCHIHFFHMIISHSYAEMLNFTVNLFRVSKTAPPVCPQAFFHNEWVYSSNKVTYKEVLQNQMGTIIGQCCTV